MGIIEWLILLVILVVFAIRSSAVQNVLADIATKQLAFKLKTTISIDKLDIVFVDKVDLKGVLLMNETNTDTILYAKSLLVDVEGITSFQSNNIQLDYVELKDAICKIDKDAETGVMNLRFLIDFFKSNKQKKKKDIPHIRIDKGYLKNIRFQFDNNQIARVEKGMDYQHLYIDDIEVDAENISILDGVISAKVNTVVAKTKSGFELQDFDASLMQVSDHGVVIKDIRIKTPYSDLYSKQFKLLYARYQQFRSFVDSVAFDADLHDSRVSLRDIAHFAPQLDGMNQLVSVTGKASRFVKNLRVEDFILETGKNTLLKGTINLPDFRDVKSAFYQERLDYVYLDLEDLQAIQLPYNNEGALNTINLSKQVRQFKYFEASDIRLDGIYSQFVLASDAIKTAIGSVNINNGVLFTHNPKHDSYFFKHSQAGKYDIKVNQFDLGQFIGNSMFGTVDGTFSLNGEAFSFTDIHFDKIAGNVNRFDLADYSYSDIVVRDASLVDKILTADVLVEDQNLTMNYKGQIDLNGEPKMDMQVDIDKAFLGKLKFTDRDSSNLVAKIQLKTVGVNPNTMSGTAIVDRFTYVEGEKQIEIPSLALTLKRGEKSDYLSVNSSVVSAEVEGKIDFNEINLIVQDQLRDLFPGYFEFESLKKHFNKEIKKQRKPKSKNFATFDIAIYDVGSICAIFAPELTIAPGTQIDGKYDGVSQFLNVELSSEKVSYKQIVAKGIDFEQLADSLILNSNYQIRSLQLNDSIILDSVHFTALGNGENIVSQLTWNPATENQSNIQWNTQLISTSNYNFIFQPSYFSVNKQRWEVEKEAIIAIDSFTISAKNLRLISDNQFINIEGKVSKNDVDKMNFELANIDLNKLGLMLGLNKTLEGEMNGWGYISNPYSNLTYMGDLKVDSLAINDQEVGNITLFSQWNKITNNIDLSGDLIYKNVPTFQFEGRYDASQTKNKLNFDLVFDNTNIAFANAFFEPLVISDIKGFVEGKLHLSGSFQEPILDGFVNLNDASAKVVILGTSFKFNGEVYADKEGFYIDYIPISDVEGNTGSLTGSIYHSNFQDWNFDVAINIEDDYYKHDPAKYWVNLPLEKFLVMNTDGQNGELYYGKAYATGTVGISGYLSNLEINVDLESQKGTWVDLSLFRQSELSESNFVEFISDDTLQISDDSKIDFTGVTMNLNFNITPDARIKMIFNEQTGDEITAYGEGNLKLGLDNVGQMTLDGVYTVRDNSKYNFVLGPIKETFYLANGGNITWTGNPYEANLNLQAYYKVRANLGDLSPDLLTSGNQNINCYLYLTESLMKPTINFDIVAPKASESDQSFLSKLTTNPEELNRQFFSLILWKKFQPIKGTGRASGGAALDLATNQINSILNQISKDYKFNVDMNSNNQGNSEYALGIEKGFLDDKLIVSGSFGARNATSGDETQSSVIGDIEVEYKLNKSGTFRVNVFNISNDNRGIQSNGDRGLFKQGIGVYYRENFNSLNDFQLLQMFFDIFRKKENKRYPIRRKKTQTPVPQENEGGTQQK